MVICARCSSLKVLFSSPSVACNFACSEATLSRFSLRSRSSRSPYIFVTWRSSSCAFCDFSSLSLAPSSSSLPSCSLRASICASLFASAAWASSCSFTMLPLKLSKVSCSRSFSAFCLGHSLAARFRYAKAFPWPRRPVCCLTEVQREFSSASVVLFSIRRVLRRSCSSLTLFAVLATLDSSSNSKGRLEESFWSTSARNASSDRTLRARRSGSFSLFSSVRKAWAS
mmetsp:Transcript_17679/g.67241  ORF Transcript_17679/g.67241 Transcript_17679/m.67241 type:complete len:227 (-) Transcript_17679:1078-1758(-)